MRFTTAKIAALGLLLMGLAACTKNDIVKEVAGITPDAQAKISAMGFRSSDAYAVEGGYIVEGDIFLTEENVYNGLSIDNYLVTGKAEQYRTTNLVTGLPRNITVMASTSLPSYVVAGIDAAIARYNAEGLQLTFQRITSGTANITLTAAPKNAQYLASAGFPTSTGNPHNSILVNVGRGGISSSYSAGAIASIIAHEMGHCIGFRHTDYMDRSYSCGGAYTNEGASTVGAVHIAGTPTVADPGSWMLACTGSQTDRPFNNNDKTALTTLY